MLSNIVNKKIVTQIPHYITNSDKLWLPVTAEWVKTAQYFATRFLGYRNYYTAALAAAPKKVFLPPAPFLRAKCTENLYNAEALRIRVTLLKFPCPRGFFIIK